MNGNLHNDFGPAVINMLDGMMVGREWWLHGERILDDEQHITFKLLIKSCFVGHRHYM